MTDWKPQDLCTCVGSELLGWTTAALSVVMLCWCVLLTLRCVEMSRHASSEGQSVWMWLAVIVATGAIGAYGAWAVAIFAPQIAVPLRIAAMLVQSVACLIFWFQAAGTQFMMLGKYDRVGHEITEAVSEGDSDCKIASLSRQLVQELLPDKLRRLASELQERVEANPTTKGAI